MKKGLIAVICSVLIFGFGSTAFAVDKTDCNMTVIVIRQIVISETNGIDFGTIYDSPNGTCAMDPATGNLTGDACATASGTAGVIHIEGAMSAALDLELVAGTAVDGISFVPDFDGAGTTTDNTKSLSAASPGTLNVNVGGVLTVGTTTPTAGTKPFTYTFRCTYQ